MRKSGLLVRNTIFTKQKFPYKRGVYMGVINSRNNVGVTKYKLDNELQYFGDDGATYLKKISTKLGSWGNNYICVGNLCENFIVKDVIVTYPITTTTTTMKPVSVTLITSPLDNEIITTVDNNGIHQTSYNVIASGIIPNYTVRVYFSFSTLLQILSETIPNSSLALANISIVKNGLTIFNVNVPYD